MVTKYVDLSTSSNVKNLVGILGKYDFDIDLISGRYTIDAKSILGIFSLDLSAPIEMQIHCDDCSPLLDELAPFIVDAPAL